MNQQTEIAHIDQEPEEYSQGKMPPGSIVTPPVKSAI